MNKVPSHTHSSPVLTMVYTIMYNISMIKTKVYTIREFRAHMKDALDLVDGGQQIQIKRGNKVYTLNTGGLMGDVYTVPEPDFVENVLTSKPDIKFCKHNAVLGFCKKGCK